MATEIERKFLVLQEHWAPDAAAGIPYRQGYLPTRDGVTVRVRIGGNRAFLTVKGATEGISRAEFEFPIPVADAELLLDTLCLRPLIEKVRYRVRWEEELWEVDVFEGGNRGLIVAEIELKTADQQFARPPWLGREVSDDPRYFNAALVHHPYSAWRTEA